MINYDNLKIIYKNGFEQYKKDYLYLKETKEKSITNKRFKEIKKELLINMGVSKLIIEGTYPHGKWIQKKKKEFDDFSEWTTYRNDEGGKTLVVKMLPPEVIEYLKENLNLARNIDKLFIFLESKMKSFYFTIEKEKTELKNFESYKDYLTEEEIKKLKSLPYKEYLKSEHWKTIREYKLIDVGRRCQICNSPNKLAVHHRCYNSLGEEFNNMHDLTVLCYKCHSRVHGKNRY